ncbi:MULTISPECIES: oligosaccharide flippase family protein [unclassified Flavobacterium]|uniref:oligosaccharide flippase family protein n=1 Tax=unclassified Flavobacterium TaxID=196869 RepID=UPI0025BB93E3|nr:MULTISPECIES: oligosaccharide flippase family protein [unclassified Flavobacterium]
MNLFLAPLRKINNITTQSISFKQLLSSGRLTFLYRILGLFLNFFITFFITKNYGEGVYGNYSLIFTMLQASTMLFALGLPNAIISYLGLHKIEDHFSQFILKKGLKIVLIATIIPCGFYFFFREFIALDIFGNIELIPYLKIIVFTLPFAIIHELILNFFIATKNFLKFNIFMFLVPNFIFLLLLVIISISKENESITFAFYSISISITLIVECFFAFKKSETAIFEKLSTKQIIQFSSSMMLSSLMLFLLNWTDVFMLGFLTSTRDVGIYNLAYKLASLTMLVIISMNVVLAPKISELYRSNKLAELHKTIKNATRIVFLITIPIVLFLIVFGEIILGMFGANFIEGKTALFIIAIGMLLNVMTGNVDQILNMTNNQKILRNITIFGFVANVALNTFLIPKYGINGAAIASLITNVFFNAVCLLYIKRKLGFYTFV